MPVNDAALQHLAAMPGLQLVSLSRVECAPECGLRHLPPSITQLRYRNGHSLPPRLQQLTGLLSLELEFCNVPPTLLGSVTQLQALKLDGCWLLPSNSDVEDPYRDETQALVGVLPALSRLQDPTLVFRARMEFTDPLHRFDVLTASSRLTRLVVGSPFGSTPLPAGAVQQMFPVHQQQPQLQCLDISPAAWNYESDYFGPWCLDSAGLTRISSCCPGLRQLNITRTVHPDADLSGLLQLPSSCTSLSVGGAAFTEAATATLVQLTQLRDLSWRYTRGLTVTGLEQLTALDLNRLRVDCRVQCDWTQVELSCDQNKVRLAVRRVCHD